MCVQASEVWYRWSRKRIATYFPRRGYDVLVWLQAWYADLIPITNMHSTDELVMHCSIRNWRIIIHPILTELFMLGSILYSCCLLTCQHVQIERRNVTQTKHVMMRICIIVHRDGFESRRHTMFCSQTLRMRSLVASNSFNTPNVFRCDYTPPNSIGSSKSSM